MAEVKKQKSTKLFSWRQGIVMGLAVCAGVALSAYRSYTRKGYLGKADIGSMIVALLMCLGICASVAWWGNRAEKED